jgi:A/G-specific adenine glycosylase
VASSAPQKAGEAADPGLDRAHPGLDGARTDVDGVLADPGPIRAAVLGWYDAQGRTLPFRGSTDPWAILVSEAMAQQTQAARAGEAWRSFMAAYPTPAALAAASPADVLRAWRGLGYNRRALALRSAAQVIGRDHGGRVPDDLAALERLPGVGPYTSRAVAALAFGRAVGAIDTNVRRVLRRVAGPGTVTTPGSLQRLADRLVDPARPGDWTHALMDVGATICRPGRPDCAVCPLSAGCRTAPLLAAGAWTEQAHAPVRRRTGSSPHAAREERAGFRSTARWLRGRIVDRLRDAPGDEWVHLDGPIGDHDPLAIAAALDGLERDGLLERHGADRRLVRLPAASSGDGSAR